MDFTSRKARFYFLSFLRHDLRASITVFFVALPLCLGISLASGAPVYSGLLAGVIGGILVSLISRSSLSVSGPAAGLTAICAAAILNLGNLDMFFIAVAIGGLLQALLGLLKLGGFTHFIPSAVIKGMLTAIGILLIAKQIPFLIGYDQPDFWSNEFVNLLRLRHGFSHVKDLYHHSARGAVVVAALSLGVLIVWKKYISRHLPIIPASFITVLAGIALAFGFNFLFPVYKLEPALFVQIPQDVIQQIHLTDFSHIFSDPAIWRNGVLICFVASLETLLSITAIDNIDPYNRITPQNRELVAQGIGNMASGALGGLPITAVIVRSSANAEAGARTKLSSIGHGLWILLAVVFAIPLINLIPLSVLAVILIRTGYNLAKPKMIIGVWKQGREQFLPFAITVVAILFTDLLIGVLIGMVYALYFLVKHTYRAGYSMKETKEGHLTHYKIELALNVSFLNKKRIREMLDQIPEYAIVEINGADSVYIDHDILEIIHDFKAKAHRKHIELKLVNIPDVETIELH
ncbi:MAG TPA: SulP family inorganic anion transporter [Saprospiraceae bacterium]|nr:SulP family inorganic anion transporter [Saprospiraceae bacterium]